MATPTNASAIAAATAANQAAAAKAAASAAAAKTAQAKQAAAKQTALTALQNSIKAKTTGVGAINSAAAATAGQTAIDLSNQYVAALQAANTAAAYTPVDVPAPVYDTTPTSATTDAYALIADSISTWFGGDPATTTAAANFLKSEMQNNIGANQALVDMRNQQFYLTRFAGNTARQNAGLNVLSEAEYIALENSYSETLNGYGLNNYFGTSFQSKTAGLANLIGGDISATEFQSRVKLAEDQVINSDPNIVNQLKSFYNIDTTDLMKYYLDPTQNLSALTMKTQAAQIGTAAVEQGLTTSASSAMNLAQMGVTQNQAQSGYAAIGQMLPTATKLSQIYGNQSNGYTQTSAEAEQFNLANASAAALEKQKLIDLEKQQFQGRSGVVGANASANYSGSLGKSIQGSF